MKIYLTILYVVGTIIVKNSVSGKSLIFNKYSNGPHFEVQKQENGAFDDSKENLDQEGVEDLINSYKRSADEVNLKPLKRTIFENSIQKRSPYGLVYNQGKPIGILEPIAQSFEYSSYGPRDSPYRNNLYKSQWFPVKRSSELDMDETDKDQLESQTSALHSSNYANVLAKFKVNNKVKHRPYQDYLNSQVKRAASEEINRRKDIEEVKKRGAIDMGNLKANAKSKSKEVSISDESSNKADGSKIDEIEENLKDVMGDMGLVEKDKEMQTSQENDAGVKKREIYFEDEDLENGLNKIGLTKEAHYDRNKKEDCPGKTKVAKSKGSRKAAIEKSLHKKGKKKVKKDDEIDNKRSVKTNRKRVAAKRDMSGNDIAKAKVANYQYEGEEFIRRKRQGKEAEKTEDSEIMKDLETSGDLTVSGNKSPLVAVTNADDPELKKSQEKRDKEELEYEKRLERNIQAKINAIKEEVKREVSKMKDTDKNKKEQQRKKREVTNTLLDEETNILDPGVNIDQKLEPHIRKRRDLNNDLDKTEKANKQKLELKSDANNDGITSSKTVREASKTLSSNSINQETATIAQKVKRSEADAKEIKIAGVDSGGSSSIAKREDKLAESGKEIESSTKGIAGKSVAKRQAQDFKEENSPETAIIKEVEKRDDAFAATDKVETDIKAEFGTDAPDSIVKRNDQEIASLNDNEAKTDSIVTDAANIMKRDEKELSVTTDKCVDNNNDMRQDRSAKGVTDLQTGQTLVNLDDDSDTREERESNDSLKIKTDMKSTDELKEANDERVEETREERSANSNKGNKPHDVNKQEKLTANHKTIRRNTENENDLTQANAVSFVSSEFEKKPNAISADNNEVPLNEEMKESSVKQRNVESESSDKTNDATVEERSVNDHNLQAEALANSISERSAYSKHNISSVYADAELVDSNDLERGTRKAGNKSLTEFSNINSDDKNLNDEIDDEEMAIDVRRKRRMANQKYYAKRHKRDETSYSENKPELINYRADNDGEIDDEDDEMHDDGFDDQTSNFMNKRQADYESNNYESNDDKETNEDYPLFVDRNKRNALRVYDDENDAEESYDNFLFYPNKYSRMKRHNYENLAAIHGGGMTQHAAALRERNMQPYQQNLRRKRLEKMNRMHEQNGNADELSESDIFGGFPQSYEGELSRFKRVKRSYLK